MEEGNIEQGAMAPRIMQTTFEEAAERVKGWFSYDDGAPQDIYDSLSSDFSSVVWVTGRAREQFAELFTTGIDVDVTCAAAWEYAYKENLFNFYRGSLAFPLPYIVEASRRPLTVTIRKSEEHPGYRQLPWRLTGVSTNARRKWRKGSIPEKLIDFAFFPRGEQSYRELECMALSETWNFPNSNDLRYREARFILKNYLTYTYVRLRRQDKVLVSHSGSMAAFNTGLVSPTYDDIYALFVENGLEGHQPWVLKGFCTAHRGTLGIELVRNFSCLPEYATYFSNYDDYYFDYTKDVTPRIDHIFFDHVERIPKPFLENELGTREPYCELLNKIKEEGEEAAQRNGLWRRFGAALRNDPRNTSVLTNRLEDAISLAKRRCRWNYKTAIPMYYPVGDSVNLLLPLAMEKPETPDLALVITRELTGNYIGQSILDLQKAYMDARLVCRPDSDWLTTNVS